MNPPAALAAKVTVALALAALMCPSAAAQGRAEARTETRVEVAVSSEARAHFDAGVRLLLDPEGARYEEAYREFRTAYGISPSPRILGNVGLCAMKLERDAEAVDAYSRYLVDVADIDEKEREQIGKDLLTLRSGLVRVTLTVSPDTRAVVDTRNPVRGVPVTNVYTPENGKLVIGMRAGHHVVVARAETRQSPAWEVDAAPGAALSHTLTIPPPMVVSRSGRAPSRLAPWLLTGIGGAVLLAGGTTGILALRERDRMEKACPGGECPVAFDLDGARGSTKTFVTATDVLLVAGGALTATGLTWLLLSPSSEGARPPSPEQAHTSPTFACTGQGCAAGFLGTF